MIARITGTLLSLDGTANAVLLEVGDIAYEVMVPGYSVSDLSQKINRSVTLFCLEYHEGSASGSNFVPRLVGFPQAQDKAFFQRFISVKGIGIRKALRALARPLADIAYSIEQGDTKMLITLPEIGKRTAEQIIAELKGKMEDFAIAAVHPAGVVRKARSEIEQEAIDILIQLGERADQAENLIERVMRGRDDIKTTDAIVQAVYRAKAGSI